jgi:peptidoglycan/LPS O-acetylase OafA/YrhL
MATMPDSISLRTPRVLGRQPGLDGIRGLAILLVLVFHFNGNWLPGGYFGVDVFFALSGFLITTLLLEEQFQSGRIDLRNFVWRRCLRLYPALVCLVIVSTLFTLLFNPEISLGRTAVVAAGVLGYVANWMTMLDPSAFFGGMPHTWSLAVEVHFYLLWATVLVLAVRRMGSLSDRATLLRALVILTAAAAIGSLLWRTSLWAGGAAWLRYYNGTEARLDGLFIGAFAAVARLSMLHTGKTPWLLRQGRWMTTLIEAICVAVILVLCLTLPFGTLLAPEDIGLVNIWAFTAVAAATAVLMLVTIQKTNSLFSTAFRLGILVWLGRVSYSVYIWHLPAEKFVSHERLARLGLHSWQSELVRIGIAVILGAMSYYIVERTFLRFKGRRATPPGHTEITTAPVAVAEGSAS